MIHAARAQIRNNVLKEYSSNLETSLEDVSPVNLYKTNIVNAPGKVLVHNSKYTVYYGVLASKVGKVHTE